MQGDDKETIMIDKKTKRWFDELLKKGRLSANIKCYGKIFTVYIMIANQCFLFTIVGPDKRKASIQTAYENSGDIESQFTAFSNGVNNVIHIIRKGDVKKDKVELDVSRL